MIVYIVAFLKIWGGILLSRVVIALLLALFLLFLPFHYEVLLLARTGEGEEDVERLKNGIYQAELHIHWLLYFLHIDGKAEYDASKNFSIVYAIKVLGQVLFPSTADDEEEISSEGYEDADDEEEKISSKGYEDADDEEELGEQDILREMDTSPMNSEVDVTAEVEVTDHSIEQGNDEPEQIGDVQNEKQLENRKSSQNKKTNSKEKTKKTKSKGKTKTKKTFGDFLYDLAVLRDKKDYVEELLYRPESREAIASAKRKVAKLLVHILPRSMKGDLILGTGACDTTGIMYGVYCSIFFPRFYDRFVVTPDFEQLKVDGEVEIKGKLRLWTIIILLISFILDSNIRELYRNLQVLKDKNVKDWDKEIKRIKKNRKHNKKRRG